MSIVFRVRNIIITNTTYKEIEIKIKMVKRVF